MKKLLDRFRRRLASSGDGGIHFPPFDLAHELAQIERREAERPAELGRRIHHFRYRELELALDRDVLGAYRVTVHEGRDRRYSFTIRSPHGDYPALGGCLREILAFLDGARGRAQLPDNERLKGHFYGV